MSICYNKGPVVPWRAGRKDGDASACTPDGRLPDASKASDHLREVFYRMGFNDQEIVALSGFLFGNLVLTLLAVVTFHDLALTVLGAFLQQLFQTVTLNSC